MLYSKSLRVGDLCQFYEFVGIFMGLADVEDVQVRKIDAKTLSISFKRIGEIYTRISTLSFNLDAPDVNDIDLDFIMFWIDGDVKILPRARALSGPMFWDDNLTLLNSYAS